MRRLLIILTVIAGLALAFFGLLADATPQTSYLAQNGIVLFLVIVGVVIVTSLVTGAYIFFFGVVGDRFAKRRLHRFVGWKLLRSQRKGRTLVSSLRGSLHRVVARSRPGKLALLVAGLAAFVALLVLQSPSAWNSVAEAVSADFATALQIALLVLGGVFFLVGLFGLVFGRNPGPAPLPVMGQRFAVTLPTFISIVGVSIGIWALIVVLGVMHGLQDDLRQKILRTNAHILIEPERPDGALGDALTLESEIASLDGVAEAHAYVTGEVMISSPTGIAKDVTIKGMSDDALAHSQQLEGAIVAGSPRWITRPEALIPDRYRLPSEAAFFDSPPPAEDGDDADGAGKDDDFAPILGTPPKAPLLPGILLGSELANNTLLVDVGMEVQLISPDGDVGPTGLRPKLRSFRVAGIFRTGMYDYDQNLAYMTTSEAQRFFNYGADLNRLEARLTRAEDAPAVLVAVRDLLKARYPGLKASDWQERNKNLFSALQLERIVMLIILGFIILVASLLIVSSLVMLVVEKVREIAVLKALGASDRSVVRAFMVVGSFIGGFGILAGVPLGIGTAVLLIAQGIPLPREFYITELPVKLDAFELVIIGLAALGICLLATLYPSLQASRLKPSDGLRHG
ncbi:MAG: ABC transporter permease [Deltaproteobacteria bacterium]|nr:MAG: ABC transporter permease [Deltaproteobacteria bacterium]